MRRRARAREHDPITRNPLLKALDTMDTWTARDVFEKRAMRSFELRFRVLRGMERPTLGDFYRLQLPNFRGALSDPRGAFSCPMCWQDFVNRGQYRGRV